VQDLVIKSEAYASQVKLTPEAVKAYYDGNQKDFQVPPQVRAEYVVFNMDALIEQAAVSEDEVRQRYEATIAPKFKVKDAARKKIEGILAAVRKDPASFAEQAKANSEDEGSAKSGGDLDFVGPGATVKPFEEVLFKLKENEISGVVESEFGFHIIKLVAIKPGTGGAPEQRKASHILIKAPAEAVDFAQAKDALTKTIKAEKAQKLFAEGTDGFADLVYTQPDSLKPAADKYKLKIQSSALFSRANPPKELANPKLLERLFGDDAVKNKRNTEAVELVPGTLVSARVVEYKPQSILPFDDAKANITTMLTRKEALALARKDGEAKLKAAQANADAVTFGAVKTITRGKSDGVEPAALKQVMGASAAKLPVVVGTELPDGYAIYRINKVSQPEKPDPQGREAVKIGLARAQAESDFIAYLAALKVGAKVELRPENLEKKQPN
jgi:peptidyl-prolyl cis-trans isomerase D